MKRGPGVGGVAVALAALLPSGCGLLDPCAGSGAVSGIHVLHFGEAAEGTVVRVCIDGDCADGTVSGESLGVIVEHDRVVSEDPLTVTVSASRDGEVVVPPTELDVTPVRLDLEGVPEGCDAGGFQGMVTLPAAGPASP